ncbi:MAG: hypothetical protein CMN74_12255 [Sphingorhabdus sp.]|nr:hypothetical protein [Sphingorhabdus sp.]|tara:strand:+ start:662 stop:883 length:222 start_codon:yes stop_codon:yes gene_type:complete
MGQVKQQIAWDGIEVQNAEHNGFDIERDEVSRDWLVLRVATLQGGLSAIIADPDCCLASKDIASAYLASQGES